MRCPKCGGLQSTCINSRSQENDTIRVRRHKCLDCGTRWNTLEISEAKLLELQQKARAPFLRDRAHLFSLVGELDQLKASLVGELDQLKAKYTKML